MLLLILIWFYSSPVQSQEKTSHFGELHQAFIFKNLPNHTCRDTWCGNSLQLREQRKIASFTKIRKEAKKVGITVSSLSHCVRTSRWNNTWPLQILTPCWFYRHKFKYKCRKKLHWAQYWCRCHINLMTWTKYVFLLCVPVLRINVSTLLIQQYAACSVWRAAPVSTPWSGLVLKELSRMETLCLPL